MRESFVLAAGAAFITLVGCAEKTQAVDRQKVMAEIQQA